MPGRTLSAPCHDPRGPGEEAGTVCLMLTGLLGPILRIVRGTRHRSGDGVPDMLAAHHDEALLESAASIPLTGPVVGTSQPIGKALRLRSAPSCRNEYPNSGHMGKKNLKIILCHHMLRFRPTARGLLVSLLASACGGDPGEHLQSGRVLGWYGLQGRWIGPVVATDHGCGPTTQGLMSIGEGGFGLDPFGSTAVIRGTISSDGHLSGAPSFDRVLSTRSFRLPLRGRPQDRARSAARCNPAVAGGR